MASERQDANHPPQNRPMPISGNGEGSGDIQQQGSSRSGDRQSGGSSTRRSPTREERGSPTARDTHIPFQESPRPQPQLVLSNATPSDLENGLSGMPHGTTRVTGRQDSDMALPPLPTEHKQLDSRNNPRTPRSQRSDPFANSADGVSPVDYRDSIPHTGQHHGSTLSSNNRPTTPGNNRSYERIDYHRGESYRNRNNYDERGIPVNQGAGGVGPTNTQGRHNQDGFGAHLRQAAVDYIHEALPFHRVNIHSGPPPAHLAPDGSVRRSVRRDPTGETNHVSVIDHVVPTLRHNVPEPVTMEKPPPNPGTVSARLSSTLIDADNERNKYASKAKITGLALNVAIGLQVLLGSLTTGLGAVGTRGSHSSAVATTILGALATVVASYLARARGSNEPELSITRVKDLEQFIRECTNFKTDHGDEEGTHFDTEIETFRSRFENLLGNANGERKLSPSGGAF